MTIRRSIQALLLSLLLVAAPAFAKRPAAEGTLVADRILPRSSVCQDEVEKAESSKLPQLQLAPKLINLGDAYRREGATMEAIPVYERALEIFKKAGQIGCVRALDCQIALGDLYEDSGRFDKSAKVYGDAAALKETTDVYRVPLLHKLAAVLVKGGKQPQAIAVYKRALAACEKYYGVNHQAVADILLEYADVLRKSNQSAEAKKLDDRARAILSKKNKK
jgi:tetratricopeptide (TPR) repeat protein